MSIAEKLLTIAENEQRVYDAGFEAGKSSGGYGEGYEAGQKAEYDRFWDSFQLNGERTNYIQAFAGVGWKDDTYNPKYPITVSGGGNMLFNNNTSITSTKVPIIFDTAAYLSSIFSGCSSLNEITSIKVTEKVSAFGSWFDNCKNLQTVNFTEDSVIGNNINFSPCPLLHDSILNIISVLKDFRTTQSYDCSFKTFQEEYMADFMETFPSFAYGKFFECDYEAGVMYIFIPEADASVGIPFDENTQLPSELETAVECAFDESGESITLKFTTTTATKTLTLGATNLEKLTDLEKAEATQKGWTLA